MVTEELVVVLSACSSEVISRGSSALLLNLAQLSVASDSAYSSSSQPFLDASIPLDSIHFADFVNSASPQRHLKLKSGLFKPENWTVCSSKLDC